jgi:hypothetical protein
MCYDLDKCKETNAFFCEGCKDRHDSHRYEDLEVASEFSKKLRRLTQYE